MSLHYYKKTMKRKAYYYEKLVYLRTRPFQYMFSRAVRFRKVVYIPFIKTYFINDPAIAKQALKDTENFSSAHTGSVGELASFIMGFDSKALFNMSGEEHHDLKFKLLGIFQPQYIDDMIHDALTYELTWLKKQIKAGKAVDIAAFTRRCTARTTCHMLGIVQNDPHYEEMLVKVSKLSDDLTSMIRVSASGLTAKQKQQGKRLYAEFSTIIEKYYHLPAYQKSSIIYELKKRSFSYDDARSLLVTLVMAGTETVTSALPRIVALLIDDERWQELQHNTSLIEGALTEGIRYTSPSPLILHSTIANTHIEGYSFKKDRRVLVMLLNILRSEKYYSRAHTLDFTRSQNDEYRNFWFGAGPHFCLGSELAKKEIRAVVTCLLETKKTPTIIKRTYAKGTSFPGYKQLLVQFS